MPRPERSNPNARIYVGNIDYSTTFDDLRQTFGSYGPIKDIYMPLRPEDKSFNKGFAFVEFESADDAWSAVSGSVHALGINGRELKVSIAEERQAQRNS